MQQHRNLSLLSTAHPGQPPKRAQSGLSTVEVAMCMVALVLFALVMVELESRVSLQMRLGEAALYLPEPLPWE
jgi:hypothetical protein